MQVQRWGMIVGNMKLTHLRIICVLALAVSFPVGIGTGLLPCPMLIQRVYDEHQQGKTWKQIVRHVLFYLFRDEKI